MVSALTWIWVFAATEERVNPESLAILQNRHLGMSASIDNCRTLRNKNGRFYFDRLTQLFFPVINVIRKKLRIIEKVNVVINPDQSPDLNLNDIY